MSIVVEDKQFQEEDLLEDEVLGSIDDEVTLEDVSDDLEDSINDLPEKFKGKDINDVVTSYTELEKELGRKNNEVGELRKLTDDFLKQQLETPTEKKDQIDLDDLLENPNDVITRAMDNNPRIAALEEQLQQAKVAEQRAGFENKHSDWQDVLSSGDFQNWIQGSPVRQNMFNQANSQYDYAMADELFNLYKDVRGAAKDVAEEKATTKRKKALRNTSSSKGGTGEVTKKVYKRADLVRLKQTEPSRYNDPSFQEEILLAYSEGRVR
jgi:undecaprenyl pyrophosphate synthase